ncbi:hypothetical protein LWI29_004532 [Acer saccharum]|uniref:WIT1/2 N-terminal helical bundle domain-containing protein n=1 Tax=Acer saccharum TaxID=4024 RepID=A0AA39UPP6_ACESA|nr:hypothetical protein LWI29_004532 [Acer saccharum]
MGTNDQRVVDINTANPTPAKVYLQEEVVSSGKDMQDIEDTMRVLTTVDLDLARSAEKLVNLHVVLMHLLARDNDLETMAVENGHLRELFSVMEEKLHDSEESLKQSQEHVLELKTQSAKLPRAFSSFKPENCKLDEAIGLTGNVPASKISGISKNQNGQQQRHNLRMLEKSLAREFDLEKKISELKQNEEQLKLKLHHTEQVAFRMEEAAEVVWGRFLEADNASEVLMGISKEMLGRLQIVQFNMNSSLQREAELKSKLEDFIEEMNTKNIALQKLESSNAEHITIGSEVLILKEKVKSLEERLKESGIRLINANASYEASQEQINEMENYIESLKENIFEAESRAETAESKVTQLTDTNLELSEEINFLKGNNESDTKKVGLLENQLRELEIQLKHAKVSSEASQEQQNMLYSAIWDMETLIEDLKSKVSKAESKTESVEEQCILLSESNFELDKELKFTRDRMQMLEYSIDQANKAKVANAKEIDHRAKLMMDMVTQLATQRDHIQKQLYTLTKENKLLVGKGLYADKNASATMHNIGDGDNKELEFSKNDSIHATHMKASDNVVSPTKSSEAGG